MWYVVIDPVEGPFITQDEPQGDEGLEVVFSSSIEFEAETVLCRECNGWECEHDDEDMNEPFQ